MLTKLCISSRYEALFERIQSEVKGGMYNNYFPEHFIMMVTSRPGWSEIINNEEGGDWFRQTFVRQVDRIVLQDSGVLWDVVSSKVATRDGIDTAEEDSDDEEKETLECGTCNKSMNIPIDKLPSEDDDAIVFKA